MQETRVQSLGQEDALEEGMATHSVFSPGESHGRKAIVHAVTEADTERLTQQRETYHPKHLTRSGQWC